MAGDQYWDVYFPETRDQLIGMQAPDGSWVGDGIGTVYGTAIAVIILQLPTSTSRSSRHKQRGQQLAMFSLRTLSTKLRIASRL